MNADYRKELRQTLRNKSTKKNPAREMAEIHAAVRDSLFKMYPYLKPNKNDRLLTPEE